MATRVQFRRGTTSEHSAFTGAIAEITVNTSKNTLVVHDGVTAGGYEVALADLSNTVAVTAGSTNTLANKTFDLSDNTLTGTLAEFNAALSGDDFVSLTGSETLTNKTLTSPVVTTSITTGSSSFNLLNTTATTINAFGAATALSIGASTGTTTVNNKLTHSGLSPSSGTEIDQISQVTKSLTLTTDWQDVGIQGTDLPTGTYIIQLYANDAGSGGFNTNEYYSGTMSWFSGSTNSSMELPSDEIQLHRAGGSSDAGVYLRTYRSNTVLKLQIYSNSDNASAANYVFKFRRVI